MVADERSRLLGSDSGRQHSACYSPYGRAVWSYSRSTSGASKRTRSAPPPGGTGDGGGDGRGKSLDIEAAYSNAAGAGGGSGGGDDDSLRRSSWQHAALIIVGEIMGSGVLGLPYAMGKLGWVVGCSFCVVFGLFAIYVGRLLGRVRNDFYPQAETFGEVAALVSGPRFERFTRLAIWCNWFCLLPYYLVGASSALTVAVGAAANLCFYDWTLFLVAVLVPMLQLRTLSGLALAAAVSNLAVIAAMGTMLIAFAVEPPANGSSGGGGGGGSNSSALVHTHLWPAEDLALLDVYGAASSFIFAYQGQSMFLEIMREMKQPSMFSVSVTTANSLMGTVYLATSVVAYQFRGDAVKSFLPDSVTSQPIRCAVGLLLTYHIVVGYLLTNQPLASALHVTLFPSTAGEFTSWRGRCHWFAITGVTLVLAFFLANLIPFFTDFQNIIGSALGAPILFGWPAFFFLAATHQNAPRGLRSAGCLDLCVCGVFLLVFLPTCTVAGVASAISSLVQHWAQVGMPFSCHSLV